MVAYDKFITENVAPAGSRHIGVFKGGKKVGRIPLGSLTPPPRHKRLYSFLLLSDPHIGETKVGNDAFIKAMEYYGNSHDLSFCCITGDLIVYKSPDDPKRVELQDAALAEYKKIIDEHSQGKKIYALGGNHEVWHQEEMPEMLKKYSGIHNNWYSFEHGNDLFVMMGVWEYFYQKNNPSYQVQLMSYEDIKGVREIMGKNRNRRVFFMMHMPPEKNLPECDIGDVKEYGYFPLSFFKHYKNASIFHGHTHHRFQAQEESKDYAGYSETLGFKSVHIAALEGDATGGVGSGYIVDVYDDGYHLRGMNFVTGQEIAIGTYWVDTTLVDVSEEYTYKGE